MRRASPARCRVLYVQHVDWRWIRQRPQALAELLAERFDLRVVHRVHPHRFRYPANTTTVRRLPMLPLPSGVGRWWARATESLQRVWMRIGVGRTPDIVWVTFPSVWRSLPRRFRRAHVVYDCMDDALGFAADPARHAALAAAEADLVARASLILCSATRLRETLVARYGDAVGERIRIVRNGVSERLVARMDTTAARPPRARDAASPRPTRLAYVGTIAEWLDTAMLTAALDAMPELEIDLYGPCEATPVAHARLHYRGVVAHARLGDLASEYDALIMPFRLTELILAVDPVKLYEYLSFERPVIAVRYPEVERFAPLVRFYGTADEFVAHVRAVQHGTGAVPARAVVRTFLEANTWERRADAIAAELAAVASRA